MIRAKLRFPEHSLLEKATGNQWFRAKTLKLEQVPPLVRCVTSVSSSAKWRE